MYVVVAEFVIAPEHAAVFQTRVVENARASVERESGCHYFDVAVAADNPGQILLYELYDDRAAFDLHLKSAHFLAFDAAVKPWIKDKKVRSFALLERASDRVEGLAVAGGATTVASAASALKYPEVE